MYVCPCSFSRIPVRAPMRFRVLFRAPVCLCSFSRAAVRGFWCMLVRVPARVCTSTFVRALLVVGVYCVPVCDCSCVSVCAYVHTCSCAHALPRTFPRACLCGKFNPDKIGIQNYIRAKQFYQSEVKF